MLLSPGEEYRGIATFENAGKLTHPLFVAMGEKDESSQTAPATIFEKAVKVEDKDKVLKRFPDGEHGTNLLAKHPELAKDLTVWLAARLAR
jgi:dipeptidyl aminopeptidase/acylaminoacyl peptidase